MKRLLQYTSQKITTHPQRSLVRFFSSHFMQNDNFSIVSQKKTKQQRAILLTHPSLSRSPILILLHSYLISFYSARITSYYVLLATLARSSLLVSASASRISYLARCFSRALYLWLACIHYMYASYAGVSSGQGSASCFHYRICFPTVLVHFSSRASWLHALTSYHTLHYCSVPVQRTSRQSWLCRGLVTSAQHPLLAILLCTCSTTLSYRIRE